MNYLDLTLGDLAELKTKIKNKYYWRHYMGLIKIIEEYNRKKYKINKTKEKIIKWNTQHQWIYYITIGFASIILQTMKPVHPNI